MAWESFPMEYELQKECYPWPPKCRQYLEDVLLPSFWEEWPILFIWIAPYTAHYKKIVNEVEFITLDKFPYKKPDIIEDISDSGWVNKYNGRFATIIFNWVIWFWVDTEDQIQDTLLNIGKLLKAGGKCLIWWNEYALHRDKLLYLIQKIWFQIEQIDWKLIYEGDGSWSEVLKHRYILIKH